MTGVDVRAALDALIRERGDDYASLSRLIGRNAAYIQQFIRRGVPRKLDEEDRRVLSAYFGVDEAVLGGPGRATASVPRGGGPALRAPGDLVLVPRLDIGASAGSGALGGDESISARLGFQAGWLRNLVGGNPDQLSIIQVRGDSMAPTLSDGDDILINRGDAGERLRDGIYVLRIEEALLVKRLALNPSGKSLTIRSDNPSYPDWSDCRTEDVHVIGRVVWAGRRIS
ncbi:helix-turn-helix transcriptional regulator [Sphingomonas sp. C3-2]|uniref:S24 family peptidase n=1 Tax=Sphingomonas sp. C3-2 TaxID=3062169 RepID=UPI00294ACBD7|nr:S24 family peptidase [Sphingomonas sp. C3-2]WOK36067.1 S24 family peptidase [Sphingomonas sp. C3-2]